MTQVAPAQPYLPQNSTTVHTVQPLKGDRRFIAFYEGRDHLPLCITRQLTLADCLGFLNSDHGPVTFTVRVPLDAVVKGPRSIIEHIEVSAFAFEVSLHSCEFRPVGAVIDEFDSEFAGDVLLQVSCSLSADLRTLGTKS
ncbi:hypothetical protein D3C71_24520 [compost metagenome]